jgi:hypothetical protein
VAEPKTKPTRASPSAFLERIPDETRRKDCKTLAQVMKRVTGAKPVMWGASIVGFGSYRFKYASGNEADWPVAGFSPRKSDLTIYVMSGFAGHEALLRGLGKHKTGKACLYIKKLADVDLDVLEALIRRSVEEIRTRVDKRAR